MVYIGSLCPWCLQKISLENPFDEFGRCLIDAVEMLRDASTVHVSDFMCLVYIIERFPTCVHWDFSKQSRQSSPVHCIHFTRNSAFCSALKM